MFPYTKIVFVFVNFQLLMHVYIVLASCCCCCCFDSLKCYPIYYLLDVVVISREKKKHNLICMLQKWLTKLRLNVFFFFVRHQYQSSWFSQLNPCDSCFLYMYIFIIFELIELIFFFQTKKKIWNGFFRNDFLFVCLFRSHF